MARTAIITTRPHGAQIVHECDGEREGNKSHTFNNRLFTVRSVGTTRNGQNVTMTGEELTDLASQWTHYANVTRWEENKGE
jgi:hypothetical protein